MHFLLRLIIKLLVFLLILLFGLILIQYLSCPVYDFSEPGKFNGPNLYNPYFNIDSANWLKGNFQVQSKAWGGVTDGRKNSNELINEVYSHLGYDIIAISDYQKINTFGSGKGNYLPVYEHGYGIEKNHHVVIGAHKVVWLDYPLFQNLNHKQHIFDRLRPSADLVYIAHPAFTKEYDPGEMKYLSNYDGIEVLNGFRRSVAHWDSALSAGRYVTILANDDAHDVSNPDEVGQFCTFINAKPNTGSNVLQAMKQGAAFGAAIPRTLGESLDVKAERHKNLPRLCELSLSGDTVRVVMDSLAKEIRFIGQAGQIRASNTFSKYADYLICPEDTYIRTEIEYPDGTTYYLNPVARYQAEIPSNLPTSQINKPKTMLIRGLSLAGLIGLWIFYRRKRINYRKYRD
jgi:hypothetical protein